MEALKLFVFAFLSVLSFSLAAQPAEAQLWRCGLPRLEPDARIDACTAAMTVAPDDAAPWHNRGIAYLQRREFKAAILDFTGALRRNKDAKTHVFRGVAFSELGEYERAMLDLEEGLRMAPKDAEAHNALAWLLATAGTPGFRDGRRAVDLAKKANGLSGWRDAAHLDTLAAAYAEAGDFAEAVRWQEKALADPAFKAAEHKDAQERLALYRARKAYRHVPG
jgi:tetratricopeptide (TPR) repeat protein